MASLSLRPCGFKDFALGRYRARRLRRSWIKPSGRARCEWALWSHVYLSGEMRAGDMIFPVGVWTPIMSLPKRFHGDVGGTRDVYGACLGMEFLPGSPSSKIICRESPCGRQVGRGGEEGVCPPFRLPLGGVVGGAAAFRFVRVGACADELRLMGVGRSRVSTGVVGVVRVRGFFVRKSSKCMLATQYGADVERPMGGRCELDYAVRG